MHILRRIAEADSAADAVDAVGGARKGRYENIILIPHIKRNIMNYCLNI